MAIKTSTETVTADASQELAGLPWPITQTVNLVAFREGNENPNWKQIIADGGNATTNLVAYQDSVSESSGIWKGTKNGQKYSSKRQALELDVGTLVFAPPRDIVSEAKAAATTKAYSIINRLLSQLQGQVFLGELQQTVRLLKNPFAQTVRLMNALAGMRKRSGVEFAKSWLEFQFGMKPLLSDIDAIMGLINETIERNSRKSFRAYGEANDEQTTVTFISGDIKGFTQRIERSKQWKSQYIIRFAISQEFLEMANERKTDWRRQFDDVSAIPITAWELVPFSFLIDYFVNVSDIIQAAVTSTTGVTFWSNSSIRTHIDRRIASTDIASPGCIITLNIPRVITNQRRWVNRDGTALGIPSVQFSLPGSNIRYLNIAALLVVLTAGAKKR